MIEIHSRFDQQPASIDIDDGVWDRTNFLLGKQYHLYAADLRCVEQLARQLERFDLAARLRRFLGESRPEYGYYAVRPPLPLEPETDAERIKREASEEWVRPFRVR